MRAPAAALEIGQVGQGKKLEGAVRGTSARRNAAGAGSRNRCGRSELAGRKRSAPGPRFRRMIMRVMYRLLWAGSPIAPREGKYITAHYQDDGGR
jgi:hypothetical protein